MFDKLHIFISLIAGIVYTIYAITSDFEFFFWIKNVIIILVLFYVLGLITRNYMKKVLAPKDLESVEVTEIEEELDEIKRTEEDDTDESLKSQRKIDFNSDDEND